MTRPVDAGQRQTCDKARRTVPTMLIEGTPSAPRLPEAQVIDQRPALRKEISDVPDLKIEITDFAVSGVPDEERAAIQAKLTPMRGPDRSFQDILDAAGVVRSHLNGRGYFLAQAYIPEQKLQGGVVEIAVLLGRLGKVELNYDAATPVPRSQVQAHLDRLRTGDKQRFGGNVCANGFGKRARRLFQSRPCLRVNLDGLGSGSARRLRGKPRRDP